MSTSVEFQGSPCPLCKVHRTYKTRQGAKKSTGSLCRACANSISQGGVGVALDSEGTKLCADCKELPRTLNALCGKCNTARRKTYYREHWRFKRHGITKEWFEARFRGHCEICCCVVGEFSVCIDHDHATGDVRGLLCKSCNSGLGMFKDNQSLLANAITYLRPL